MSFTSRLELVLESIDDHNARIEHANGMRRAIAAGHSLSRVARAFGVSKARLTKVRQSLAAAGWEPGQPIEPFLVKPRQAAQPQSRKYPGMSRSEVNKQTWADPEYQARMAAFRNAPEYRAARSDHMKQTWAERGGFEKWLEQFDPAHAARIKRAVFLAVRSKELSQKDLELIAAQTSGDPGPGDPGQTNL